MLPILLALAPVFLLIFIGHGLKRWGVAGRRVLDRRGAADLFLPVPSPPGRDPGRGGGRGCDREPMALAVIAGVLAVSAIALWCGPGWAPTGPAFTSIYRARSGRTPMSAPPGRAPSAAILTMPLALTLLG